MFFSQRLKTRVAKLLLPFLLLCLVPLSPTYAANGNGQRQDVLQRTMQYAQGVDLVEIGRAAKDNWVKPRNRHGSGSVTGMASRCDGYTMSECGKPCCGKRECELICQDNVTLAHGGDMCLSPIQTSECGMSCCGAEDCANVCLNYRIEGDCAGYSKTPDGQDCCGYEDCRRKACGSYTSVTSVSGDVRACCGRENCEKVRCDYQTETTGRWGGPQGVSCCGREDCYSKECNGQTSVDSRVDPNKTDLPCCGPENCNMVACDGYVSVQTPEGATSCCGYEDCHAKECQNMLYVQLENGQRVPCCGERYCNYLKDCYTSGKIATCVMRFEDAAQGVTADLKNDSIGNAFTYIGIVGDNYWGGNCAIYEHWTRMRVMQPKAITKVILEYAKWDDYLQVYIGGEDTRYMDLVYEGPHPGQFPPETDGACELSTSWETRPGIDVTKYFRDIPENSLVSFKTRVSVTGGGEGYARLRVYYDVLGAY